MTVTSSSRFSDQKPHMIPLSFPRGRLDEPNHAAITDLTQVPLHLGRATVVPPNDLVQLRAVCQSSETTEANEPGMKHVNEYRYPDARLTVFPICGRVVFLDAHDYLHRQEE
jgi:hypothetical protein